MPRQKPLEDIQGKVPGLAKRPESVAGGKRDRSWDEANRAFSFRIRERDAERLAELAQGLKVSRDALTRALVELALHAADAGWIEFEIDERTRETTDRLGRFRLSTRRFVRAAWTGERNPSKYNITAKPFTRWEVCAPVTPWGYTRNVRLHRKQR